MTRIPTVGSDELLDLVGTRRRQVAAFLDWANEVEKTWSMRTLARPDIEEARKATAMFAEAWWGIAVFTCFGSLRGTSDVAPHFQEPVPAVVAEETLAQISFRRPAIGHHRIQQGITGAKLALIAACENSTSF